MELTKVPFSHAGSYMALIEYDGNKVNDVGAVSRPGLYLKSTHGKSKGFPSAFRIYPLLNGEEVEYTISSSFETTKLSFNGGEIDIWFDDEKNMMLQGYGKGVSIGFDTDPQPKALFEFCLDMSSKKGESYLINSYKSLTKYYLHVVSGKALMKNSISRGEESLRLNVIEVASVDNLLQVQVQEVDQYAEEFTIRNFEQSKGNIGREFQQFINCFGKEINEKKRLVLYVMWSNIVRKDGLLKRPYDIWMSNTHFAGVWSWDHAYNALGLSGYLPDLAYDTMLGIFDYQDEKGQLPGSYSDSSIRWNFCKPPVHGLIMNEFLLHQYLTLEQKLEVYTKIGKQVDFWLNYSDVNHDGLPEYQHGNDCGYDNASVFADQPFVTSPDLPSYLVKSMDFLSKLARELDLAEEAEIWLQKADRLAERVVEYLVVDDYPVARDGVTGKVIKCASQLPLTLLLLNERLPEKVKNNIISAYKSADFLTDYGIATEKTSSELYQGDGYWLGPIWPSQMTNIYLALKYAGEKKFALTLAEKFVAMVDREGVYENFNSLTGEGNDDTAHTWTAGAYLFFDRELKNALSMDQKDKEIATINMV